MKKGKTIWLFGRSGSGKTTLIDIVVGLLEPESGEIIYNDKKIKTKEKKEKIKTATSREQVTDQK